MRVTKKENQEWPIGGRSNSSWWRQEDQELKLNHAYLCKILIYEILPQKLRPQQVGQ